MVRTGNKTEVEYIGKVGHGMGWSISRSLNRKVLESNPTEFASNLGQVRLPHVAYVSRDASSIYPNRMAVGVKPKEA